MKFTEERRRNISIATKKAMARPEVKAKLVALKGNGNGFKKGKKNRAYGIHGEEAWMWKGDDISYAGIHMWLRGFYGQASHCEFCGKKGRKKKRWNIHWALKSGMMYERKRENFLMLCVGCHVRYDRENITVGRKGYVRPSSLHVS